MWTELISEISETSVGWSSKLATISMSDEWWKTKIQEIREAKKSRHAGIEPSLWFKFSQTLLLLDSMRGHHLPKSCVMMMLVMMAITMPMLMSLIWKKKAVILRRMAFQILRMIFVTWLVGLKCPAKGTHVSVARENKKEYFKVQDRKKAIENRITAAVMLGLTS